MPKPFSFRLTTMLKKGADAEIAQMRNGSQFGVNDRPVNANDAIGACASYLSGTRDFLEFPITKRLKAEQALPNLRTLRARELRDAVLLRKSLGFVHQAYRYRGKANYRDALFLTYEGQVGSVLNGFITDTATVLKAFLTAAGAFCFRRVPSADWYAFTSDLNEHLRLAVMPKDVWSAST